jgi:hypothetical protein
MVLGFLARVRSFLTQRHMHKWFKILEIYIVHTYEIFRP